MKKKFKCPSCHQTIEPDLILACMGDSATEIAVSCDECGEIISAWVDHKGGWSDRHGNPVDVMHGIGGGR